MPRDLDLTFDISTGALTLDRVVGNYVKRSETLTLSVTIVSNGASATIPAGLIGTLKPVNTYGTTLAQWTTFAQVGATNVYTASTTINAAAVTTLLGTTTEQANCVFDFAGSGVVESDTLALVLKNNVTRDDDTAPTALLNRNDFLVSNGTGLLVNVAAGYAANGAFVAAQASLAITNATNYIEVTAAGVASVNTTAFTAGSYPLATVVASAGAITANTDLRAWITPKPATSTGLTVGTTAIASGTSGRILYDNAGVLGEATTGTGVLTALGIAPGTAGGLATATLAQANYLAATFDYFDEWMTFISSTDAATWKRVHTTPIVTTEGTIRDPAFHYNATTGTFHIAYTRNSFTGGNSWGLGSSTDGRTWTWSTISTGSLATGTPADVWIGDWFVDADGTEHVLFAARTTASQAAGGLYLYETHPTTSGDYSAWSTPVQITGSAITNNLGNSPAMVKVGSTYHLFYDLPSAGGIRHATSTSLTSGFNTAGTYPSFPSATEGPAIITLANGTYRLYAEQNYQQSTAGLKYSDSTDLVTWGSVQSAVTQGYMGHPHAIQVTSQALLNKVSMLEQGQKNPIWSTTRSGNTAVAIGYPDINTESAFGPYGEGLTIFGGASGGSYLYVSTRNQNGAAIFTDPNASSPAGNNFYIARRSGLNYMKFDGGANNVSFYGTATFLGSTSGSATISVSATGGLLALPSGTTATNMTLTTPALGTPSAIVLTNASGTASININGTVGATTPSTGSFTTLTASSTTSLLLGTAGSAVGNVGFRNATSGTTTLAPATGALGTGTVTLPLSGTLAISSGANTFTGVQSMTSPDITTSITTPSTTFALLNTTATTVNFAGGASTALNMGNASGTNTVLGFNVLSTAGAASKPVLKVSGVPFAGTGTTSFPLVYINDANATASTTLSTAGTYFGVNGDGTQDLMNLMKDGVSQFKVGSTGIVKFNGGTLGSGGAAVTLAADNGSVTFLQYGSIGIVTLTAYNNSCNLTLAANAATATFGSGTVSMQNLTASGALIGTPQALSGAGAVNVTTTATDFTSTGAANALTLANGTAGQFKFICHAVKGTLGTGVLTPTTCIGFTTITFNNAGDSVTLRYTSAGWAVHGSFGAVIA